MSGQKPDFRREVRDTIVKSGLTGVAATVLAVTLSSPAGLGGMIGTSLASGAVDPNASDAYATLPPYPAPLTAAEVSEIRGQLAATAASLALTREATDDTIAHMRSIAGVARAAAPAPTRAAIVPNLRVAFTSVDDTAMSQAVSYTPTPIAATELPDPNLELADMLFSYDSNS